jgi:hypothetical protein
MSARPALSQLYILCSLVSYCVAKLHFASLHCICFRIRPSYPCHDYLLEVEPEIHLTVQIFSPRICKSIKLRTCSASTVLSDNSTIQLEQELDFCAHLGQLHSLMNGPPNRATPKRTCMQIQLSMLETISNTGAS